MHAFDVSINLNGNSYTCIACLLQYKINIFYSFNYFYKKGIAYIFLYFSLYDFIVTGMHILPSNIVIQDISNNNNDYMKI